MRDGEHYKLVISLKQCDNRNITARIPHQSRFARQLPPGGSHALRANTLVNLLPEMLPDFFALHPGKKSVTIKKTLLGEIL